MGYMSVGEFFAKDENVLAALGLLDEMQNGNGNLVQMKSFSLEISKRFNVCGTNGNLQGFSPTFRLWAVHELIKKTTLRGKVFVSIGKNGREILSGELPAKFISPKKDIIWKDGEKNLSKKIHIEIAFIGEEAVAQVSHENGSATVKISMLDVELHATVSSKRNLKSLQRNIVEAIIKEIARI